MRLRILGLASILALSVVSTARADVAGVNLGAPVWKGVIAEDALTATTSSGAHYVRVNFRLDDWASPDDPTKIAGKTWFEVYDHIVDDISARGLEVYGLLSDELAPGFSDLTGSAFEEAYAKNARMVIDRYKDRVRTFETINEPNDWAGGTSARVPSSAFARLHARVYDDVKQAHAGDACWQVDLVTGPLFSFDDVASADYLDATIVAGRGGGRWKALRDALGHDPIDGVGYHLYVAQGMGSPRTDVAKKGAANLDAVRAVLNKYALGDRKVWVSEIGWRIPDVDEATQADRLDAMFETLGKRSDVASLQWFSITDFPGNAWGLFRDTGFSEKDKRPSWSHFSTQSKAHAPELAARLELTLPKSVTSGSKIIATVKAHNLGRTTWTQSEDVRLGAAPGCPAAWATNQFMWDAPSADVGYAKSATDARWYLKSGTTTAQGESTTFEVSLTAPTTSTITKTRFAVRMVREGVAWFGSTAFADVEVVPGLPGDGGVDAATPSDANADAGADAPIDPGASSDASGCGCRTGRSSVGAEWWIGLLLLALARARKRVVYSSIP